MSYRKLYPQILAFALIFAVGCASPAPEEAAPAEPAAEPAAEAAAEKIVAPVQPNVVKQVEKLSAGRASTRFGDAPLRSFGTRRHQGALPCEGRFGQ